MTAATQLSPLHGLDTAPCQNVEDKDLFFGPADSCEHQPLFAWERRALLVCAGCPIRAACLAAALEFPADEQHGVIGGTTAAQRRRLLAEHRRPPARSSMTGRNRRQRPVRQLARDVTKGVA